MANLAEVFQTSEESMPSKVRGLTPALAALADEAAADGLKRVGPNTPEILDAIEAIKRYMNRQGMTVRIVPTGDQVHWQVVEKRERAPMSAEHKAKLLAAGEAARAARAAQKASVVSELVRERPEAPSRSAS